MKKRWPIVTQGDWMQLTYEEAETREEALLNAATRHVELINSLDEGPDARLTIGPRGVTGQHTPTVELRVLYAETLELESEWTIPDQFD